MVEINRTEFKNIFKNISSLNIVFYLFAKIPESNDGFIYLNFCFRNILHHWISLYDISDSFNRFPFGKNLINFALNFQNRDFFFLHKVALHFVKFSPNLLISVNESAPIKGPILRKQSLRYFPTDAFTQLFLLNEIFHCLLVKLGQHRGHWPSS